MVVARALGGALALLFVAGCSGDVTQVLPSEPCTQSDRDGKRVCGEFGDALGTTDEVFVTGRLVREDADFVAEDAVPADALSQDEMKEVAVELRVASREGEVLGTFATESDDEGWLAERLDLGSFGLEPGRYALDVYVQSFWAARAEIRLLAPDHEGALVLSDIDLTYLNTDFQSADAILDLLDEPAEQKETLPAMDVVYRELRAGSGDEDRPLTFLSGSPQFFRRVLTRKTFLDEVEEEGILLKPLWLLLLHEDLAEIDLPEAILGLTGDVDEIFPSATDQIGYKLTALLAYVRNLPPEAPLLLLGDDSETDAVSYALLHRVLGGELAGAALDEALDELDVADHWREAIEVAAPAAVAQRGSLGSPVSGIFVNLTSVPNAEYPAADWLVPGISRQHQGAWPLVLELREAGFVGDAAVERVRTELEALGQTAAELDAAERAAIDGGFLAESGAAP